MTANINSMPLNKSPSLIVTRDPVGGKYTIECRNKIVFDDFVKELNKFTSIPAKDVSMDLNKHIVVVRGGSVHRDSFVGLIDQFLRVYCESTT